MSAPAVSFVAPAAYPLGGVATWLDRIVPDLREQGVDTQVVLASGRHHDAATYLRAHPAIAPAVEVRSATSTRESRVQALAATLAVQPRQTVISVNIPDVPLAIARLRARGEAAGLRAVMSIHGLEPDLFADLTVLAPMVDGVICTNRLAQARAERTPGLDPWRVHYAPYGTPAVTPATRVRGPGDAFTIGFAGRFERFQKRIQDLEPIVRALEDRGVPARWLIAGDGPDRDLVEAMARNHPQRVDLLGPVEPHRMADTFHQRCDVLLNPSEWETGPIIVWEAMANHVAVVSSRYTGSGREGALCHGENCLLFNVGDVDDAAACLARVANESQRARLCRSAHAMVRQRYSPQASCAAWVAALQVIATVEPRRGKEPPIPPAGRLDRWFGTTVGERLRRALPRRYVAAGPGSEWPHTHAGMRRDDPTHWSDLRALDTPMPTPSAP